MTEKKTTSSLYISFEPSFLERELKDQVQVRRLTRLPWIEGSAEDSLTFFLLNLDLIEGWSAADRDVFFKQLAEQKKKSEVLILIAPRGGLTAASESEISVAAFYKQASTEKIPTFDLMTLAPRLKGSFFTVANLFSAGVGYSKEFLEVTAGTVSGLLRHFQGRDSKLIILDLDETLWPGILAEDQGQIGDREDPLFRATVVFQKKLKELKSHGFLLALCTKNESSSVHQFFEKSGMPLAKEDFVRMHCSWEPKYLGVQKIIGDLGISASHVSFIDNSPFERELIKQSFPEIAVLPLSTSYFQRPLQLDEWFGAWHPFSTREDLSRTQSYQNNSQRENLRMEIGDLDRWILSLQPQLLVESVDESLKGRALQLLQRTNQFNCVPKAEFVSPKDFKNFQIFSYRDRLGDDGPIALVQFEMKANVLHIHQFVLSCRVFGRTIEDAILKSLMEFSKSSGANKIHFKFSSSSRNKAAQEFLLSDRFQQIDAETFQLLNPHKTLIPVSIRPSTSA